MCFVILKKMMNHGDIFGYVIMVYVFLYIKLLKNIYIYKFSHIQLRLNMMRSDEAQTPATSTCG